MNLVRHTMPLVIILTLLLAACSEPGGGPETPASLQGVITDSGGAPVASADIALTPAGDQHTGSTLHTTSNQAGAYAFTETATGTYNLIVTTGDGRGSFRANITITGTATVTVNIEVTQLGAISGAAILEGQPDDSAGIDVYIPGTSFIAKTANDGTFHLSGVPAGAYDVYADARGHKRATLTGVTVTSGATTPLPATITLAPDNYAPEAAFTTHLVNNLLSVDASASNDPDGTIASYAWDFGDGATGTGITAQHTYSTTGLKTITLTVTDDGGRTDSLSKQVDVETAIQRLAATTDPNSPLTYVTISPGATIHFEIDVTEAVAAASAALYVELDQDLPMEVTWRGDIYYSSSSELFSLNPIAAAASPMLKPSAIGVVTACRGSCVILEARNGTAQMSLTNPTAGSISVDLFAFTEDFQDTNEPANNTHSGAAQIALNATEIGAIELIGDVDYYQVAATGTVSFDSGAAIDLVANVYDSSGHWIAGPFPSDSQFYVLASEYIRVEAATQSAAASANSAYYLTLE